MLRAPFDPTTDYYGLLGVSPSASVAEIRAAYRRLAKAYHPDLNGGSVASARMARLNRAKAVLLEPATRAAYDAARRARLRVAATATAGAAAGPPAWPAARPAPVRPGPRPEVAASPPATARPGLSRRRAGQLDRQTALLVAAIVPFVGALLVYVVDAAQVASQPPRRPPSDLTLAPITRASVPGMARDALALVAGQPPSERLGLITYQRIRSMLDSSPEAELLRAAGRRLYRAGTNADAEEWRQAVAELCVLAGQC